MFNLNSSHALYMMSFCLFDCTIIKLAVSSEMIPSNKPNFALKQWV